MARSSDRFFARFRVRPRRAPWLGWALAVAIGAGAALPTDAQPANSPKPRRPVQHAAHPASPHAAAVPVIESIAWRDYGLVVRASAPLSPQIFSLNAPFRFVVDLPVAELGDATLASGLGPSPAFGVRQVRLARKAAGSGVRLVLDCEAPTGLQLVQLGDRSTFVIALAGQSNAALAGLLHGESGYTGSGQELKHFWSREAGDELQVHLEGSRPLTYSLFQTDPAHVQLRVPAGHARGILPIPGRWLERANAKSAPDGTWLLDLALAPGSYQLVQTPSADRTGLTLSWTRLDPHRFANRPLVVIDPGHGGSDPGALGPGGTAEKRVCLELAYALQRECWKRHLNAVLTRSSDAEVYLAPRLELIDRVQADLFISLHANSHVTAGSTGTITFWREPASQAFARAIQHEVATELHRPDRGVKQERLYVLRNPHVPSVLLETGFISNPTEEKLLADGQFQARAAAAIARGVERYWQDPAVAQARRRPPV